MKGRSSVAFSAYAKLNFRIILVGCVGVGKTSLIQKYVKNIFTDHKPTTQSIEFYSKTVSFNQQQIALQIWDTVGSHHFKNVMKSFYQQASCVFIMYSDPNGVKDIIDGFLLDINEYGHQAVKIVIVRSKVDEIPMNEEQKKILEEFVNSKQGLVMWKAVSAKTGENVEDLFKLTAQKLLYCYNKQAGFKELVDPKKDSFLLNNRIEQQIQQNRSKKRCCKG